MSKTSGSWNERNFGGEQNDGTPIAIIRLGVSNGSLRSYFFRPGRMERNEMRMTGEEAKQLGNIAIKFCKILDSDPYHVVVRSILFNR